jgi:hypothetical protein
MSAYVPPWKRKLAETATSASSEPGPSKPSPRSRSSAMYSVVEITTHLGGKSMGTVNVFSYRSPPRPKMPTNTVKELLEEARERETRNVDSVQRASERSSQTQGVSSTLSSGEDDVQRDTASPMQDGTPESFIPPPTTPPPPPPPSHPYAHLISWIHYMPASQPCFATDQELWFHTNSKVVLDTQENLYRPIPLFGETEEVSGPGGKGRSYSSRAESMTFLGYWCVLALQ